MPGIVRRMLVLAAIDGLILQPVSPRNQKPATEQAIKVSYKTNAVHSLHHDRREDARPPLSVEAHGVVGLLKFASSSFLVLISGRDQVAQIQGNPIYALTDVAVIPLSNQSEAEKAIEQIRATQQQTATGEDDELSDTDSILSDDSAQTPDPGLPLPGFKGSPNTSEIVEDVFKRPATYGRFAERWFSRRGWRPEPRQVSRTGSEMELSEYATKGLSGEQNSEPQADAKDVEDVNKPPETVEVYQDRAEPLLPKVLSVSKLLFTSRSFYFSYEYDLSRSITEQEDETSAGPLGRRFNSLYFWNRHILTPFIEAGQDRFVLPLLQGFVGQREFEVEVSSKSKEAAIVSKPEPKAEDEETENATIPEDPQQLRRRFLLTLISRRSTKRAGLRYLRRGVDEEGNVANSVETEQIFSSWNWDDPETKVHSFTQYRGSIPLFFSQSPYSLKPTPVFFGSREMNRAAFKLHFTSLIERYGKIQAVSLVDKKATEQKIGQEYENLANEVIESGALGEGNVGFHWFDFHHVCRGMKFENVSVLLDTISEFTNTTAWSIQDGDRVVQRQSGVLRINCMDCLDRTNVVQSACGREVLEKQLAMCNVLINLQTDPSTSWFNTLWADNGDAISSQYAGTAALKGDFTRTRKRNISGALNDFRLTMNRYFNNIVNDYLAQAVIDFLLGRATAQVFADFEAEMMSQDYAVDLQKLRQGAIDTCLNIAVEDAGEVFVGGYVLTSPRRASTLKALPFEECVLLLTERALYLCRIDWTTEKLREFERVELEDIIDITRGVYITSTLASKYLDEARNVGIVIRYTSHGPRVVRTNTRSLDNLQDETNATPSEGTEPIRRRSGEEEIKFWALKVGGPASTVRSMNSDATSMNERDILQQICQDTKQAVDARRQPGDECGPDEEWRSKPLKVEEADIISVAEAKRSTGLLEQMTYNLKRLVWT